MLYFSVILSGALASPSGGLEPVQVSFRHGDFRAGIHPPTCSFNGAEVPFDNDHIEAGSIPVDTTLYGHTWPGHRVLLVHTGSRLDLSMTVGSPSRRRLVGALFSGCEVEMWLTNRNAAQEFSRSERRVVSTLLVGRLMAVRAARMRARGAYDFAHQIVPEEAAMMKKRRHFEAASESILAEIRELSASP